MIAVKLPAMSKGQINFVSDKFIKDNSVTKFTWCTLVFANVNEQKLPFSNPSATGLVEPRDKRTPEGEYEAECTEDDLEHIDVARVHHRGNRRAVHEEQAEPQQRAERVRTREAAGK